jgi:hypothetical protein
MKKTIRSLRRHSKRETLVKEQELEKTKKMFERSLSDIRNVYERSYKTIEDDINEFELLAQEQKQQRAKLNIKHLGFLRTIEKEMQEVENECDQEGF